MRLARIRSGATLVAALLCAGTTAHATDPAPKKDEAPPAKRQKPNYDGRGGAPRSPGQKSLWVPRVLLFPAYVVSEYVVRRPLGALITHAEKSGWPAAVSDFLALDQVHPVGIVPFMLIDFGFEPSAGLYAYWDDAGFKGHQLRFRGSTWGPSWLSGTLTERFLLGPQEITLTATATRRPDYAFYGIGPDTRESALTRYQADTVYARAESKLVFGGRHVLEGAFGYRGARFGHSDYDADDRGKPDYQPSVDEAVALMQLPEPPGFRDGYRAPYGAARLVLDSRGRTRTKSGVRVELSGEESVDLANSPTSGWVRYGGTVLGFVDLSDGGRTLSLALSTTLVDPLGDRPVPFTQLAAPGGGRSMPGLRSGRLYGRSAVVAMLRYSWPIWLALKGSLQAGLGNVFGPHFEGIRPGRVRVSTAIGLETNGSRDSVFQALVGFGTETVESGAALDTIRVALGVRSAF
ncbi:MAG: hypothetical protein EOO73_33005 [Myxococcales bacterium]|nr:MAG: hypothetical protein EOO73_33005 [Myxococcales bacterium]